MNKPTPRSTPLSKREHEVLTMLCAGMEEGEIAKQLGVTIGTVYQHANRARARIGCKNTVQLGMWASANGYELPFDFHEDFEYENCNCKNPQCNGLTCEVT